MRRKDLGYTQKDMSLELDVSSIMVAQWERSVTQPSEEQLQAIAELLICSVDFLKGTQRIKRPSSALGERLKNARNELNISQGELALRCGWENGQKRISNYETNEREPGYAELLLMSKRLGADPAWLAFGAEAKTNITSINEGKVKYHVPDPNPSAYQCGNLSSGHLVPYFLESEPAEVLLVDHDECDQYVIFSRALVEKAGVDGGNIISIKVISSAMSPVLPIGTVLGVDCSATDILDGETYLITQGDMMRIRIMHRQPRGYRLKAFNSSEYPDETVEGAQAEELTVVGRVFWWSVIN
ncbi:MAG: helix-turn-helix domain-containing protein [Reinekea sp.]